MKEQKIRSRSDSIPWTSHVIVGLICTLVIALFAWSAEPGFLDLENSRAKDAYYNLLVQGFRAGQLNVNREAPPGLTQLADPYDPAANASYRWQKRHETVDLSYYKGKLYLYFGVTPALVLFWPYVILTDHYLPHKDAVVIFCALGFLVGAGLVRTFWRSYFPEGSIWLLALGVLALGLATGVLEILSRCDIWEVAISCGFAFVMLTLGAIWFALREPKRQVMWLALASLAYGLSVGARPSLLFGGIILLIPVARAWCAASEPGSRRQVGSLLVAAVGPAILIGLGLMLYNVLRFDNPFEFGWHYQLATDRQVGIREFSLRYLWFNFWFYFFEPLRWGGHFPFLQVAPLSPLPSGYWGVEAPYCGILSDYPLVWLALAVPLIWRGRPAAEVSVLRWFVAAVLLLVATCAFTLCLFFSAGSRYELDFLPALMLLAVMGIFGLERALASRPVWRRIARGGWCLLLAYTVAFNLLASAEAHAAANCATGNSLLNQGQVDEAFAHFQTALALWPECANAHEGLGDVFRKKGRLNEAIAEYQKIVAIWPDFVEAHNNLGLCLLQEGQLNEAILQFQRALELKPGYEEAQNNLGLCLLRMGRVNEAIPYFQKALELKPDYAEADSNLGFCLLRLGRVNEAVAQFQRALESKPDSIEIHNNFGYCLLRLGRVDEAITQFQRSLEIQQNYSAYYELGRAFYLKRMPVEAIASYQKAIELQPQSVPAKVSLAWVLATWPEPSVRDGEKAIALAEQANQLSEDKNPLILRTLAAAYAEAGRFPEAVSTAQQALMSAGTQANTALVNVLQKEIGMYKTNSPFRSVHE